MKIHKNSWHWRYLLKLELIEPWSQGESICSYFWKLVFGVLVIPLFALLVVFMLSIPLWWWLIPNFDGLFIVIIVGGTEIAGLLMLLYTAEREKLEGSIAVQWAKAKKDKVCPILEVVE